MTCVDFGVKYDRDVVLKFLHCKDSKLDQLKKLFQLEITQIFKHFQLTFFT